MDIGKLGMNVDRFIANPGSKREKYGRGNL
jgi:hypothetical protein